MSESIQTTLIYCNRGDAKVKSSQTNGQYINDIPHGIKVEAGDTISVESIAVGTIGSGSEVIEIPERIANYNYITNKMQMEMMSYINHNGLYDAMLPLQKNTGGGSGFGFYNSSTDLTSGSGRYGYSTSNGFDLANNGKYIPTSTKEPYNIDYSGKPMYLGSFCDNPRAGLYSPNADDESLYPSNQVFNFFTKKIILDVPIGYNSPQNLSKTLTSSLHQSNVTPNYTTLNGINQNQPTSDIPYFTQNGINEGEFSITDGNGTMEQVYAIPRTFTNGQSGFNFASPYTSTLATTNPFYHYWGSRLLCRGTNPAGTTKNNNYLNEKYAPNQARDFEIYSLTTRAFNVNPIKSGFTIVTNLPYNGTTLLKLRGFLHSQKQLEPGDDLNTDDLFKKQNQKRFFTQLHFGRNNDAAGENVPLANSLIGLKTALDIKTRSFYDESYVGNAFINSETTGCSINTSIQPTINGKTYTYREAAQYLDMNVVPVKTKFTPTSSEQTNIGIVIDAGTILIESLTAGENFLVDFSLYDRRASLSILSSTETKPHGNIHTYDDLTKQIFIGAPEMTLTFDEQVARFKFQRLYWSNYITNDSGNDKEANASAGNEVITINPKAGIIYVGNPGVMTYRYAQCGMSIYDLSVFDLEGNTQLIDWYDDKDIESKFTQSLLWRLGFRYKNFINKYGIPLALQLEKYYNTRIATPNVTKFSYPLTSNPRFDTTLVPSISTYDNGLPAWRLSLSRGQPDINIASEPNDILASALPRKLATPMWLIESDIIEGINYTIDGKPKNVIAVVNRAYSNSDFVFSFATTYKFVVTNPFVITHIKSNILTSDLIDADVDDETSIIYKIEHLSKLGENSAVLDNGIPYEPVI